MTESLDSLFAEHARFVWRVLKRYGVQERDVEDACQEVFMVVHRRRADFDGRASMRTWIYGIAANVARNARRSNLRRHEVPMASLPDTMTTDIPFEQVSRHELLLLAERCLRQMAEDKREVFALYELDGLTMAEVARSLNLPESTALSRLYAARDEIQRFVRAQTNRGRAPEQAERMTR